MKLAVFSVASVLCTISSTSAFVPLNLVNPKSLELRVATGDATAEAVSARTGKPTGTSFLPSETVERCEVGSPIEKAKIAKDATSAWVDVYEYARKIREGEMTWEEVEKADLNTVRRRLLGPLNS